MPAADKPRRSRLLESGSPGEAATASGRRISGAIFIQLGSRGIAMAVAILTVPLMARTLEPEGFGVFTAGLAYVAIFASLTELGLTSAAMQRMTADPERESEWLSALVALRVVLAVLSTVVCVAMIPLAFAAEDDERIVTLVLALTIIPSSAGSLMSIFHSRLRVVVPEALSVLQNFLWLGTVLTLVAVDAEAVGFAAGFAIVTAALAAMQVATVYRQSSFSIAWGAARTYWRPLFALALPLAIAAIMIRIYLRVDALLLLNMAGADEAGYYGAAYRFLDPLTALTALVVSTFYPAISGVFVSNRARARELVQRCAETLWLVTLPIFAVTLVLAGPIIDLLFGDDFARSAGLLPILMGALVSIGFGTLAGLLAPVLGLQWRLALYSTVGALANVALNLVLIPEYGAYGSAVATLVTEVLTMALMFSVALRRLGMRLEFGRIARTTAAVAGLAGVAFALKPLGLVPALVGGALVYPLLLVVLGAVRPHELRTLLKPQV